MLSPKRRKLDAQTGPSSPASAVSAIAARRRLAASAEPATLPLDSEKQPSRTSNAFSLLRNLSRQGNSLTSSVSGEPTIPPARRKDIRSALTKSGNVNTNSEKDDAITEALNSRVVQYSSFRPNKHNHRLRSDGVTELRLEQTERFLILGSFGLRVLEGQVAVAGATLRPSEATQWIYAPHCHSIPVLRTREHTRLEIHTDGNGPALRQLGRLSPLMRRIWYEPLEDNVSGRLNSGLTFQILYSSEDAPRKCVIQDLASPPAWNKKLAALVTSSYAEEERLSVMVCGPKSSGKSTFARILTNRLLSDTRTAPGECKGVIILDVDPGQPEYSLPGTLSLILVTGLNLSPSFVRAGFENPLYKVVRSHSLASVSPASNPELYRECLVDLYKTYQTGLSEYPLIINTAGWIQGTGLELLEAIIGVTSPTEVLYMSEEGPTEVVETLQKASKNTFTELPSQQSEFTTRTAAHLRSMQIMSYFHSETRDEGFGWNSSPLSTIPPWQVYYAGTRSGIRGIISYDYQSSSELLAETVNGMQVAVVEIEDIGAFRGLLESRQDQIQGTSQPSTAKTPEGLPFIPNPQDLSLDPCYSRVIGLALIRGIDSQRKSLQLLTPIPIHRIETVKRLGRDIVLVHGKFDAPSWAYTEDLYYRNRTEDAAYQNLTIQDEDTSEDDLEAEPENVDEADDVHAVPWIEVLKGNQKRPVGSKVWRVRRDLGRNPGED